MEAMKGMPDKAFDLAIVDPPYFSGPEKRGFYGQRVLPQAWGLRWKRNRRMP
jgi:site-specific DNA-methyltransferase (adenine-specific)